MTALIVFVISFITIAAIIIAAWWYEFPERLLMLVMGILGIALVAGLITCVVMAIVCC